jgi:hypothetical protein
MSQEDKGGGERDGQIRWKTGDLFVHLSNHGHGIVLILGAATSKYMLPSTLHLLSHPTTPPSSSLTNGQNVSGKKFKGSREDAHMRPIKANPHRRSVDGDV